MDSVISYEDCQVSVFEYSKYLGQLQHANLVKKLDYIRKWLSNSRKFHSWTTAVFWCDGKIVTSIHR